MDEYSESGIACALEVRMPAEALVSCRLGRLRGVDMFLTSILALERWLAMHLNVAGCACATAWPSGVDSF